MLLTAHDLALNGRFGPATVELAAGSMTMVIGPNGAGKTSLFHVLIGHGDTAGDVHINGQPLAAMPSAARMQRLAFLPASRDIAWPVSAYDVVMLGLAPGMDRRRVDETLERLAAHDLAARPVNSLSTGERTRILLARALASRPDVLLLDEPLANLDPAWRLRILDILAQEAGRGAAVMLSVHDLFAARQHKGQIMLIDKGRIVAEGDATGTMTDERLSAVFGVKLSAQGMVLT